MWLTLVFVSCRPDQLLPEKCLTKGKCKAGQRFLTCSAFCAQARWWWGWRSSWNSLRGSCSCEGDQEILFWKSFSAASMFRKQTPLNPPKKQTEPRWCMCSGQGRFAKPREETKSNWQLVKDRGGVVQGCSVGTFSEAPGELLLSSLPWTTSVQHLLF